MWPSEEVAGGSDDARIMYISVGPVRDAVGRGLHSFPFQLNVSAFYGIVGNSRVV